MHFQIYWTWVERADLQQCRLTSVKRCGNNDDLQHELWGKAHGKSSDKARKIIMVALMA